MIITFCENSGRINQLYSKYSHTVSAEQLEMFKLVAVR